MKTKLLSSFLLTVFVLLFSVAMVSAADFSVSPSGALLTQSTNSVSYTINPANASDTFNATMVDVILNDDGVNINPTVSVTNFTVTATEPGNMDYKTLTMGYIYGGNILIKQATNASNNQTVSVNYFRTFCKNGAINDSDLELSVDISNKGEGEDDEWITLDRVKIDVEFENNDNYDIDDVVIELGLYGENGKNVAEDLEWISDDDEEADIGDVDEDEDEEHTFEFKVSNDIDEGGYVLIIKAYSEDNEGDICIDYSNDLDAVYFEPISIDRESDDERQVIFEDVDLDPSTAPCGQEVTLTAEVYNIGENDQEFVKAVLYNNDLNISIEKLLEDLDMDESQEVVFSFSIPKDAEEKRYTLSLFTRYDYDEDEDDDEEYPNSAFDEKSDTQKVFLKVEGNCIGNISDISVDAVLSEDTPKAIIGRQVVVEVTIENTGDVETIYTVSVSGVTAWTEGEVTIDPDTSFTLAAGESKVVEIYLDIDKEAEVGDKEFTIKTIYGSKTTEQKVLITLEEGWAASVITDNIKDNWFIYLIILINVALIIAIIIVISKMVAARPRP